MSQQPDLPLEARNYTLGGPEAARAAYEAGLHDVGENKVQEALRKMAAVDVPVRWHLNMSSSECEVYLDIRCHGRAYEY